jgi:hypothetical protein
MINSERDNIVPDERETSFMRAWWDHVMGDDRRLEFFLRLVVMVVITMVAAVNHGWEWLVYIPLGFVILENWLNG